MFPICTARITRTKCRPVVSCSRSDLLLQFLRNKAIHRRVVFHTRCSSTPVCRIAAALLEAPFRETWSTKVGYRFDEDGLWKVDGPWAVAFVPSTMLYTRHLTWHRFRTNVPRYFWQYLNTVSALARAGRCLASRYNISDIWKLHQFTRPFHAFWPVLLQCHLTPLSVAPQFENSARRATVTRIWRCRNRMWNAGCWK